MDLEAIPRLPPALSSGEATPIAHLNPDIPNRQSRVICGEVTVTWPYSIFQKSVAFLLAEPDIRLRESKGQIRIQLHGPSAKAVADSGLGGGDEVLLSLAGAEFTKDQPPAPIPGSHSDWELSYSQKLLLQVKNSFSEATRVIDIDHPQQSEAAAITDVPTLSFDETDVLDIPGPDATRRSPLAGNTDFTEFSSPAFIKRARISYGSLFEADFDVFDEDGGAKGKGRKRARFGRHSNAWRYTSQSPSPEPDANEVGEEDAHPAGNGVSSHASSPPQPRPRMTDEGCQTNEAELTPEKPAATSMEQVSVAQSPPVIRPLYGEGLRASAETVQSQEPPQPPEAVPSQTQLACQQPPATSALPGLTLSPAPSRPFSPFTSTHGEYSMPRFQANSSAVSVESGQPFIADQVRIGFHPSHSAQGTSNTVVPETASPAAEQSPDLPEETVAPQSADEVLSQYDVEIAVAGSLVSAQLPLYSQTSESAFGGERHTQHVPAWEISNSRVMDRDHADAELNIDPALSAEVPGAESGISMGSPTRTALPREVDIYGYNDRRYQNEAEEMMVAENTDDAAESSGEEYADEEEAQYEQEAANQAGDDYDMRAYADVDDDIEGYGPEYGHGEAEVFADGESYFSDEDEDEDGEGEEEDDYDDEFESEVESPPPRLNLQPQLEAQVPAQIQAEPRPQAQPTSRPSGLVVIDLISDSEDEEDNVLATPITATARPPPAPATGPDQESVREHSTNQERSQAVELGHPERNVEVESPSYEVRSEQGDEDDEEDEEEESEEESEGHDEEDELEEEEENEDEEGEEADEEEFDTEVDAYGESDEEMVATNAPAATRPENLSKSTSPIRDEEQLQPDLDDEDDLIKSANGPAGTETLPQLGTGPTSSAHVETTPQDEYNGPYMSGALGGAGGEAVAQYDGAAEQKEISAEPGRVPILTGDDSTKADDKSSDVPPPGSHPVASKGTVEIPEHMAPISPTPAQVINSHGAAEQETMPAPSTSASHLAGPQDDSKHLPIPLDTHLNGQAEFRAALQSGIQEFTRISTVAGTDMDVDVDVDVDADADADADADTQLTTHVIDSSVDIMVEKRIETIEIVPELNPPATEPAQTQTQDGGQPDDGNEMDVDVEEPHRNAQDAQEAQDTSLLLSAQVMETVTEITTIVEERTEVVITQGSMQEPTTKDTPHDEVQQQIPGSVMDVKMEDPDELAESGLVLSSPPQAAQPKREAIQIILSNVPKPEVNPAVAVTERSPPEATASAGINASKECASLEDTSDEEESNPLNAEAISIKEDDKDGRIAAEDDASSVMEPEVTPKKTPAFLSQEPVSSVVGDTSPTEASSSEVKDDEAQFEDTQTPHVFVTQAALSGIQPIDEALLMESPRTSKDTPTPVHQSRRFASQEPFSEAPSDVAMRKSSSPPPESGSTPIQEDALELKPEPGVEEEAATAKPSNQVPSDQIIAEGSDSEDEKAASPQTSKGATQEQKSEKSPEVVNAAASSEEEGAREPGEDAVAKRTRGRPRKKAEETTAPAAVSKPVARSARSKQTLSSLDRAMKKDRLKPQPDDLSINLARAAAAKRDGKRGQQKQHHPQQQQASRLSPTAPTAGMTTRAGSHSFQRPSTPPRDQRLRDTSLQLAKAALRSPSRRPPMADSTESKRGESTAAAAAAVAALPIPDNITSLKLEIGRRLRGDLSEYTVLNSLRGHVGKELSVIAVATTDSPGGVAAGAGAGAGKQKQKPPPWTKARQFAQSFNVIDISCAPITVVEVQIYRAHKETLPVVKPGDRVVLRDFAVVSLARKGFGLRSTEGCSYAVFDDRHGPHGKGVKAGEGVREGDEDEEGEEEGMPQIRGPPIELGEAEVEVAGLLRRWWGMLGEGAREKIERANAKLTAAGGSSAGAASAPASSQ